MIKFFVSIILSVQLCSASLIVPEFVQNDLKILQEFDIDISYISDYKLQNYYKRYSNRYKKKYASDLDNAQIFIPEIKKILKENQLPSGFLYLAMAESNFELEAKSNKKAMGIWQFIPGTGEIYNLRKNDYIDERMDFIKSTQAAVEHLKRLHKLFDKWYLAAIAYNCGEARVIEGITRATLDMYCEDHECRKDKKIRKYRQIIKDYQRKKIKFSKFYKVYKDVIKWDYKPGINELLIEQRGLNRQYIPNESRNYIRKILSLAMMKNSEYLLTDENNHLLNSGSASPLATVKVKGGILLRNLAEVIGVSKDELQKLNPHIKRNLTPPDENEYNLHIPYSKLALFNANIHNIKPNQFVSYTVKQGDSLGKIGAKFRISYKLIKKYNNLKSNMLKLNQHLVIPIDPDQYKQPKDYFVKKGDTLSKIASSFGVSLQKLMDDNNLKTGFIRIGDKIVVNFN
jgi:membrane-bound lytic murein transglycosylase D